MPELPEVYTIVSDLKKHISGFKIADININSGYNVKPDNKTFSETVKSHNIINVSRIAKNIIIELDNDGVVQIHLAMTGQILLHKTKVIDRWTRVAFELEKDNQKNYLNFTDMRMFGKVAFLNQQELQELKNKYGEEPIDTNLDLEKLFKKIKAKRTTLKNVLLEQAIIAGLGNIYATDTLFLAGIHPETLTTAITMEHLKKIVVAAHTVLQEGISNRGSTLSDKMYVDIFGKGGTQQEHFKIYSKEKCPTCQTKVTVKKINGRGTYFCENCQILITKSNGLFDI